MAKFNIYKIIKSKQSDLITKLESVGLSQAGLKEIDEFKLTFYISKEPEDINIWWTDLYEYYLSELDGTPKNKAHFGILIISNEELCYAISLGKTHFYLKEFCETDFGISLAQRIVDETQLKLKNSKLFGGKRNKSIVSYQENSELEYDSGESIQYIKAKTVDKATWGESASFGHSAQLFPDITPDELPNLIVQIESELKTDPKFILPRAIAVDDAEDIQRLDTKLVNAIRDTSDTTLSAEEAAVSGVDFIFLDESSYRFSLKGFTRQDIDGELSIQALQNYVRENNIRLEEKINNIKVNVLSEIRKSYSKPIKHFLDFVDDDRHFLLDGKWHQFNQDYINYLKEQVDKRIVLEDGSDNNLIYSDFTNWRDQLPVDEQSKAYPENYFNQMREHEGYTNFDRNISTLQTYRIEKMDLWKDDTLFFVKIGTAQKLSYVIDQANATIRILQNRADSIIIDETVIKPRRICLWLLLDRQGSVERISDINSLIFLIKLSEWQRSCINAGFEPVVKIGYKR